jgi:hypothetical protein
LRIDAKIDLKKNAPLKLRNRCTTFLIQIFPMSSITPVAENNQSMSLSWWGEVTTENYKQTVEKNARMKEIRIQLFKNVHDVLTKNKINFWIDCGTLLGAFRSGGMIPHDCDTDFAILGEEDFTNAEKLLIEQLPNHLKVKRVNDYCRKLEIFDVNFPQEPWGDEGSTWSPVSCDVYLYQDNIQPDCVQMTYYKFGFTGKFFRKDWIFPKSSLSFEGITCPVPGLTKRYLQEMYGYLGTDFFHDKESNRFMKQDAQFIPIESHSTICPYCKSPTRIHSSKSSDLWTNSCTNCAESILSCVRCSSSSKHCLAQRSTSGLIICTGCRMEFLS